jgi:hypothetical protein
MGFKMDWKRLEEREAEEMPIQRKERKTFINVERFIESKAIK